MCVICPTSVRRIYATGLRRRRHLKHYIIHTNYTSSFCPVRLVHNTDDHSSPFNCSFKTTHASFVSHPIFIKRWWSMTPHYDTHGIFDALRARRVDNIYAKFRIANDNVIINLTYGLKMETAENVCVSRTSMSFATWYAKSKRSHNLHEISNNNKNTYISTQCTELQGTRTNLALSSIGPGSSASAPVRLNRRLWRLICWSVD